MAISKTGTKSGRVRWKVRVVDQFGHYFPQATFASKAEAEAHEAHLKSQRHSGKTATAAEVRSLTFIRYAEDWKTSCRGRADDGWQYTQDQMLRDYIEPAIGSMRLLDIKLHHVAGILNEMEKNGLASGTRLHVYNLIHKMFREARIFFALPVEQPASPLIRPKTFTQETPFLEPPESRKLLEAVRDHWIGPAVWLQLYAGLRAGEMQALQVDALDFERKQILIRRTFARKVGRIKERPKQGDWGRAPMNPPLFKFLFQVVKGKGLQDFVCHGPSGVGMLDFGTYYKELLRWCDQLGLRQIGTHGLRHSSTELWIEQGASAEDIRRLLNQKSFEATKRYIHRTEGRLQELASKFE